MDTPVLLIVYNRLDTVKKVLNQIKKAGPRKLYIAGDGPKPGDTSDEERVKEVREYILKNTGEETEVFTLFQSENLGVKSAVYKALKWFFSSEEKGIILEDDCLPAKCFFGYCEELLSLYKDDKRIGMISGRNEFGRYENDQEGDYFLSTRGFVWGWATWKDRIDDLNIEIAEKITSGDMLTLFKNSSSFLEFAYRRKTIKDLKNQAVDTWDYQWSISLLLNSRHALVPKENMVKNIGFGEGATHTFETNTDSVDHLRDDKKIQHPKKLNVDRFYTSKTIKKETGGLWRLLIPRFIIKIKRKLK